MPFFFQTKVCDGKLVPAGYIEFGQNGEPYEPQGEKRSKRKRDPQDEETPDEGAPKRKRDPQDEETPDEGAPKRTPLRGEVQIVDGKLTFVESKLKPGQMSNLLSKKAAAKGEEDREAERFFFDMMKFRAKALKVKPSNGKGSGERGRLFWERSDLRMRKRESTRSDLKKRMDWYLSKILSPGHRDAMTFAMREFLDCEGARGVVDRIDRYIDFEAFELVRASHDGEPINFEDVKMMVPACDLSEKGVYMACYNDPKKVALAKLAKVPGMVDLVHAVYIGKCCNVAYGMAARAADHTRARDSQPLAQHGIHYTNVGACPDNLQHIVPIVCIPPEDEQDPFFTRTFGDSKKGVDAFVMCAEAALIQLLWSYQDDEAYNYHFQHSSPFSRRNVPMYGLNMHNAFTTHGVEQFMFGYTWVDKRCYAVSKKPKTNTCHLRKLKEHQGLISKKGKLVTCTLYRRKKGAAAAGSYYRFATGGRGIIPSLDMVKTLGLSDGEQYHVRFSHDTSAYLGYHESFPGVKLEIKADSEGSDWKEAYLSPDCEQNQEMYEFVLEMVAYKAEQDE